MSQKFNVGDRVNIMDGWWDGYQGTVEEYLGVVEGLEEHGPLYRVVFPAKPFGIQEAEASMELSTNDIFTECTFAKDGKAIFESSDESAEMEKWHHEYVTSIPGGFMGIKLGLVPYDGSTPHLHFYRVLHENKEISRWYLSGGGAICINQDKYFEQGKHGDRLTQEECVALREFLKQPSKSHPTMSTWEHIIMEANHMNSDWKLQKNLRIPDYAEDMEVTTEADYIRECSEVPGDYSVSFSSMMNSPDRDKYLAEMACINQKYCEQKGCKIKFFVFIGERGEGPIPHVHMAFESKSAPDRVAYIRLDKAEYSSHHKNGTKLNARELKELVKFFNTVPDPNTAVKLDDGTFDPLTNWREAVRIWINSYGFKEDFWEIDENGKYIMPDYSKLNDNE